jgi:hypothetical protein
MGKLIESPKLNVVERRELQSLEEIIQRSLNTLIESGAALLSIRDKKLWRETHKSFEAYVRDKWGFEKNYANKIIASSETVKKLGTIVPKTPKALEITTEGQLRELTGVPSESLAAVVKQAAKLAGDDVITAKDIRQAKEQVLESKPKADPKPEPKDEVPEALQDFESEYRAESLSYAQTEDHWEDVDEGPSKPEQAETPQALIAPIQAVATHFNGHLKELKRLRDCVGGEWLDITDLETQIKLLNDSIRKSVYWIDCMDCGGKGCKTCRQLGWLSLDRKKYLTQEQKDKVGL